MNKRFIVLNKSHPIVIRMKRNKNIKKRKTQFQYFHVIKNEIFIYSYIFQLLLIKYVNKYI